MERLSDDKAADFYKVAATTALSATLMTGIFGAAIDIDKFVHGMKWFSAPAALGYFLIAGAELADNDVVPTGKRIHVGSEQLMLALKAGVYVGGGVSLVLFGASFFEKRIAPFASQFLGASTVGIPIGFAAMSLVHAYRTDRDL